MSSSKLDSVTIQDFVVLIRENLRFAEDVTEATPLISSGIVDSFDVVTLFSLFETEYGIILEPADVSVENFDTPIQMLSLLRNRAL